MCPDHFVAAALASVRLQSGHARLRRFDTVSSIQVETPPWWNGDAVNSSEIRVRGVACGPAGCGSHTLAWGVLDRQSSRGELRTLLWFRGTQLADWTSSPPLHDLRRLPARESTVVGQRDEIDVPDVARSVDVPLPVRTTVWAHSYAIAGDATPTRHRRLSSSVSWTGSAQGSPDRIRNRLAGVTCSDAAPPALVTPPRPPSQHRRVADGLVTRPRPRSFSSPDGWLELANQPETTILRAKLGSKGLWDKNHICQVLQADFPKNTSHWSREPVPNADATAHGRRRPHHRRQPAQASAHHGLPVRT